MVTAGGFDADAALATIKKLFGPIPRGDLPARKANPKLAPRTAAVKQKFKSKFPTPRLLYGFNTVRETDPDAIPRSGRPDGTDNGALFHSRNVWLQNENTSGRPNLVDRGSVAEWSGGATSPEKTGAKSREAALKSMQAKPGFVVDLVAAEPAVGRGGDGHDLAAVVRRLRDLYREKAAPAALAPRHPCRRRRLRTESGGQVHGSPAATRAAGATSADVHGLDPVVPQRPRDDRVRRRPRVLGLGSGLAALRISRDRGAEPPLPRRPLPV